MTLYNHNFRAFTDNVPLKRRVQETSCLPVFPVAWHKFFVSSIVMNPYSRGGRLGRHFGILLLCIFLARIVFRKQLRMLGFAVRHLSFTGLQQCDFFAAGLGARSPKRRRPWSNNIHRERCCRLRLLRSSIGYGTTGCLAAIYQVLSGGSPWRYPTLSWLCCLLLVMRHRPGVYLNLSACLRKRYEHLLYGIYAEIIDAFSCGRVIYIERYVYSTE